MFRWETGKPLHESFKKLTPNNSGKWGSIETCDNFEEADYYIALWCGDPTLRKKCRPRSVINLMMESSGHIPHKNELGEETIFSRWVTDNHNPVEWWINKTYSELINSPFPEKAKLVSSITTNRYVSKFRVFIIPFLKSLYQKYPRIWTNILTSNKHRMLHVCVEGHYYRIKFLKQFTKKYPGILDLYGKNVLKTWDLSSINDYKGPIEDKWDGLASYRYSFAFENTSEDNFFTEKFTDCILAGCMPIYWGCKNLRDFFPENSFVEIDITKRNAVEEAMKIIKSDYREQNLDALKKARNLILNKYQFWPTIEKIITRLEKLK